MGFFPGMFANKCGNNSGSAKFASCLSAVFLVANLKNKMTINRHRGTAIVDTPNGILVASGRKKIFLLPGGGTERKKKESRRKAAIRELREETGLIAKKRIYLVIIEEYGIQEREA